MTTPEITIATPEDRERTVSTLVAAFTDDPILRYLFPDYSQHAPAFFGHLFDKRVHKGTIWTIQRGAAVAIWEPPAATAPDDDLATLFPPDVLARVRGYNDAVHAAMPADPHWYLGVLGTHPDYWGRRWGHALMKVGLDRAAADGLPAVLETSNPGNLEVYRRAGWEVVGSIAEPVQTWVMRQGG